MVNKKTAHYKHVGTSLVCSQTAKYCMDSWRVEFAQFWKTQRRWVQASFLLQDIEGKKDWAIYICRAFIIIRHHSDGRMNIMQVGAFVLSGSPAEQRQASMGLLGGGADVPSPHQTRPQQVPSSQVAKRRAGEEAVSFKQQRTGMGCREGGVAAVAAPPQLAARSDHTGRCALKPVLMPCYW